MTDIAKCPTCGSPLVRATDGTICPTCLIQGALDDSDGALDDGQVADVASRQDVPDQPAQIGSYAILETLGQGGMGIVYLAEQAAPIRRKVALKLIKLGMATSDVMARFDAERQALALMDHPNIASVFDAGATADGRSYFVMEYVPGVPITEFCDAHQLSTRARLELLQQVCAAVQHAHQKGIIHRDLKPSNILVMNQDGRPLPKIIDFGVARATDQTLSERTMYTEHGVLIGTPEYMSPEQAGAHGHEIDTRTDIYSLGVLMYELLVGGLPFPSAQLRRAGYAEIQRIIREEEPRRPSTELSHLGAMASDVAERRQTTVAILSREVRGDLDWITLKAIDKDPNRRYASASELAADIRRHLAHEPVAAGPPHASYRARKFVRKHRGAVVAAVTLLAVLTAGLIATTGMYLRSERFANESRHESYRSALLAADFSLQAGRIAQTRQRLESVDPSLRGWEWQYLNRVVDSSVATLPFSRDVQQVAILSDNRTVLALGVQPHTSGQSHTSLTRIALGPTTAAYDRALGDHLVALSPDGTRAVWAEWNFTEVGIVCSSRDDRIVCTPGTGVESRQILSPQVRERLVVTDTATGNTVATLAYPDLGVWSGRSRGPGSWNDSMRPDRNVRPGDSLQHTLKTLGARMPNAVGAAFSPNGSRLATWSRGNVIHLWDVAGQSEIRVLSGHTDSIRSFTFDATGDRAVSTSFDGTVRLWAVASGNQLQSIPVTDAATAAFAPNGAIVAIGTDDGGVEIYDLSAGRLIRTLVGHKGSVGLLAFSPDSSRLVSASADEWTARLWDISTGTQVLSFVGHDQGISSVAYSANGDFVATGGKDGAVRIWSTRGSVVTLSGHTAGVQTLRFTTNGDGLVSAGRDRTVRIWDVRSGRSTLLNPHPDLGLSPSVVAAIAAASDAGQEGADIESALSLAAARVMSLPVGSSNRQIAISPDGSSLAVAGGDRTGSLVAIWNGSSGSPVTWRVEHFFPLPSESPGIGFSRDGRRVAVTLFETATPMCVTRSSVYVFDRRSPYGAAATMQAPFPVLEPTFLSHADLVAYDEAVKARIHLWDIRAGTEVAALSGHDATYAHIAVSPDGSRIVTAGDTDQSLNVWDAVRRELLLTIRLPGEANAIAFSPDGNRIAIGLKDGKIQILDAGPVTGRTSVARH